jgi:hypothetical protein
MSDLDEERKAILDAIERRRDESSVAVPSRADLEFASQRSLRRLASTVRGSAWEDRSTSAEEGAEIVDDPGWAPSAALRIAALIDHLSELSSATGTDLPGLMTPTVANCGVAPLAPSGRWIRIAVTELKRQLTELTDGSTVTIFDGADNACIAQVSSWRGEIVHVLDLDTLPSRIGGHKATSQSSNTEKAAKKAADEAVRRLEAKPASWSDALVRAGFARPHFGPELTNDLFKSHVVGRQRLDVTVDVNAIVHGIVHHLARVAPRVDFARSAITDLEIQRLADHDRLTWRKACRILESFPSEGPAWRALGQLDATALLVARAEQGGKKAAGADALLAHNFEDSVRRAIGVRSVLLSTDNGLARTVAARLPEGSVWVGYVDPVDKEEQYFSPILSWPNGSISENRYSSLAELLDELLVCGVVDSMTATDGSMVLEIRTHLDGEHQYVSDWRAPHLFIRGLGSSGGPLNTGQVSWPLSRLDPPQTIRPSGARVTVEQAATALEWVRQSTTDSLTREALPLKGDAQSEAWNFLKAVGAIDESGVPLGRSELRSAATGQEPELIRAMILRFEPVAKVRNAIAGGTRSLVDARAATGFGERTFGSALGLSVGAGLVWRNGEELGPGYAFLSRDEFRAWLMQAATEQVRISSLAERAAYELDLSPVRFREALRSIIDDSAFVGARGGSSESRSLDARVVVVDADGGIVVEPLNIDDMLGLRSLAVRR